MAPLKRLGLEAQQLSSLCRRAGWRPGSDGGEADDAAAADGGRPAVAGAGGELHGT